MPLLRYEASCFFDSLKYSTLNPASKFIRINGVKNKMEVSINERSPTSEVDKYVVKMGSIIKGTNDFNPLLSP